MDIYHVYINAGHLAVDNGAKNAISAMYSLAKLVDGCVMSGSHWGQDYIEIEKDQLEIVVELLIDTKIPYRIQFHPECEYWKGLITDASKQAGRVPANYNVKYNHLHFDIHNGKRIPA